MSFNKEYMPGYTGHVPMKVDQFGMTAGEVNRQIISAFSEKSSTCSTVPNSPRVNLYQESAI